MEMLKVYNVPVKITGMVDLGVIAKDEDEARKFANAWTTADIFSMLDKDSLEYEIDPYCEIERMRYNEG